MWGIFKFCLLELSGIKKTFFLSIVMPMDVKPMGMEAQLCLLGMLA